MTYKGPVFKIYRHKELYRNKVQYEEWHVIRWRISQSRTKREPPLREVESKWKAKLSRKSTKSSGLASSSIVAPRMGLVLLLLSAKKSASLIPLQVQRIWNWLQRQWVLGWLQIQRVWNCCKCRGFEISCKGTGLTTKPAGLDPTASAEDFKSAVIKAVDLKSINRIAYMLSLLSWLQALRKRPTSRNNGRIFFSQSQKLHRWMSSRSDYSPPVSATLIVPRIMHQAI